MAGQKPRPKNDKAPNGLSSRISGDEDDVEGHSFMMDPSTARQLQRAREIELQQQLKRHAFEEEARRPHNKKDR
jgi:hypothetical protein